jgi:hypothetical protein
VGVLPIRASYADRLASSPSQGVSDLRFRLSSSSFRGRSEAGADGLRRCCATIAKVHIAPVAKLAMVNQVLGSYHGVMALQLQRYLRYNRPSWSTSSKIRLSRAGNRILPNRTTLLATHISPNNIMVSVQTSSIPTGRLVAKLRRSNYAKWERLKGLHDRASRLADTGEVGKVTSTSAVVRRRRQLQGELDFLPRSRWARESEEMRQRIEREIAISASGAKRADESDGTAPVQGLTDRIAEDLWNSEIVTSYKNAKEIGNILRQEIGRERGILRHLQNFRDETKEIHAELVEENRKLQTGARATTRPTDSNGLAHQPGATSDVNSLNHVLRSDLAYFANRVDSQLLVDNSDTGDEGRDEETWTLDELLLHLVSLLLRRPHLAGTGTARGPDNARVLDLESVQDCGADAMAALPSASASSSGAPYLSIDNHPVRTEHVELLLNCCIVETHRDDESLIRLVDYQS